MHTPTPSDPDVLPTLRTVSHDIAQQESVLRQGGGEAGHQRQRKLGRLPVRERLSRLLDHETPFTEIGLWAAWGMYPDVGEVPAAGVVCGVGHIAGRRCMVIANDATVKAGAFFPATCKKVLRAQKIAARSNLPLVYLVDSAGVFLPMQDEIFPDEDDFGRIFRNNAVLSALGVPQYAAIMGNCVAGGAYLPVLCDKILMTADSELYLAGPALVKAATGQKVDAAELGGAAMHAKISGTIDFYEPNDLSCLERLRTLVDLLPVDAPLPANAIPALRAADDVYSLVSLDGRTPYDLRDVLACIVDAGTILEYKADYGQTLICAYAAIGGRKIGVVANQRHPVKSARGELQIGGVIYDDSADKAARFIMDCNQTALPIVFLQDVQGFMVGKDAEQHGIIRSGAKMVNAVSNSTVPKITIILGGSFGAGHYALCGKAFDPAFIFAWPNARYAVMGAAQATETLVTLRRRQAERAGGKLSPEDLAALRETTTADYEAQTDIRYGAARGWVDAIIAPQHTREVLIEALAVATRPGPAGGFRGGVMQV
ncbi:MAG TPA: acyl-CoA carboxylase subunit beta [Tepidisphaeraceae bacterium]|jgi:acetyl-CoA carboxylase carboxyltransferase component|nr:acyl-CoA carboxylase subunit beta [Tepidisphaeraceae bacterium]